MTKEVIVKYNNTSKRIQLDTISYEKLVQLTEKVFKGVTVKQFKITTANGIKILKTTQVLENLLQNTDSIEGSLVPLADKNTSKGNISRELDKSNEGVDRNKKLIDEKFGEIQDRIDQMMKKSKVRDGKLDQILAMLQSDNTNTDKIINDDSDGEEDNFQSYNKPKPSTKPSPKAKTQPYQVTWTNDKRSIEVSMNKTYSFFIKATNSGDTAWPQTIGIYSMPKSTLFFKPDTCNVSIQPNKQFKKNIFYIHQNLNPGTYVSYIQLKNNETQENFGEPLELEIQVLPGLKDSEKQAIVNDIQDCFTDVKRETIIQLCEKFAYDRDSVTAELIQSVHK